MVSKGAIKDLVGKTSVQEIKNTSDTIRIWESYRDQALMWRALTLIQFPISVGAILLSVILWQGRVTHIHVPRKPAPGIFRANEIPDQEFIDVATEFVNLVASYTPNTAERQFVRAREVLFGDLLNQFNQQIMKEELKTIQAASRTQLFFVDPNKTRIERKGGDVVVTFVGDRLKIITTRTLPTDTVRYEIRMKTIPRNALNPYGIVITHVSFDDSLEEK
jgi:hypothetical protein